jgi:hypothetical protein
VTVYIFQLRLGYKCLSPLFFFSIFPVARVLQLELFQMQVGYNLDYASCARVATGIFFSSDARVATEFFSIYVPITTRKFF